MKNLIYSTIIIVLLSICGFSAYKILKNHNEKLYVVTQKRIIEAAIKCVSEKKCQEYPVKLQDLYTYKLLEKEINPVTREYYNPESYVDNKENTLSFVTVD